MSRDVSKPSEELRQLLRRIEELPTDEPRQLRAPATRGADRLEFAGQTRPGPGSQIVPQPDAALQPIAPEVSNRSGKQGFARRVAIRVLFVAVVAGVLVVKIPAISIVVLQGGIDDLKSQLLRLAPADPAESKQPPSEARPGGDSESTVRSSNTVEPELPKQQRLTLAPPKAPLQSGQAYPLGLRATLQGQGGILVVRGLAAGTKLSVGQPSDASTWQLDAGELDDAVIIPPSGFIGTMNLMIEWRLDGATVDRQSTQVEWSERGPAGAPQPPGIRSESGEITRLLKRGEELLVSGEIAAARSVFKRLADIGEARAAFALAESYEPSTLEKLGAKGLAPDVGMAQTWYERARELGSTEAQHRLDVLAERGK
jgi:hypothetical protein